MLGDLPHRSIPRTPTNEIVRAYDAAETLLGVSSDLERACSYDPRTGAIVFGDRRLPQNDGLPAQPWR